MVSLDVVDRKGSIPERRNEAFVGNKMNMNDPVAAQVAHDIIKFCAFAFGLCPRPVDDLVEEQRQEDNRGYENATSETSARRRTRKTSESRKRSKFVNDLNSVARCLSGEIFGSHTQNIMLVFGSSLSRPQVLIQLRYLGSSNEGRRRPETNAQVLSRKLVREIVAETATGEIPMPTKMFLAILSPDSFQCPSGFWPKRVESLKCQKAKRRIALILPTEDGQLLQGVHTCAPESEVKTSILFICKNQLKAFT